MSAELMSEFFPTSAFEKGGDFDGRINNAFPNLDFNFIEERKAAGKWLSLNSPYLIAPITLSLIAADTVQDFSYGPTIVGGVIGGVTGFIWEMVDGSSANKISGVRTNNGVAVLHEGSTLPELFMSTVGGSLAGTAVGAGLTDGMNSKLTFVLGLLGPIPGLTICRATKQYIWPLKKNTR